MDALKKKRTVLRTAFTKALNAFNDVYVPGAPVSNVTVCFKSLEDKMKELNECQNKISDVALDTYSEDELQEEYDDSDEYKSKFRAAEVKLQEGIATRVTPAQSSPVIALRSSDHKSKFKLPEVALAKFSGQVRD
ncbi:hypothetical protein QAD02_001944 [Eretmocerus hayati]|uniref:Uncharacterized protein n=1 Tax=Eretmocerus hayati TaxID=131215 RepID=A0ACC2NHQ2_9HYME|nr:hypothetical protein QAD02_001944 [Eretmocerus hayati]